MNRSLHSLFKPIQKVVLSYLWKAMYPNKHPLFLSSSLLINYKVPKLTDLHPTISDHQAYTIPVASAAELAAPQEISRSQIMGFNMMKRGSSERQNNAFGQPETAEEYTNRVESLAHLVADRIIENPDISYYLAQEAPINTDFEIFQRIMTERLPDNWQCYNSKYGVLTMVNTDKFTCTDISVNSEITSGMDFKYQDARFRAFEITSEHEEPFVLINLHVPHDNQGDTLKRLIKNSIEKFANTKQKVVLCGDWNATPDELRIAINQAYDEIIDGIDEDNKFNSPMRIKSTFASSKGGHQKALQPGQTTPEFKSVDGVLVLDMEESYEYDFEHEEIEFSKSTNMLLGLAILVSSGLLFAEEDEDEQEQYDFHRRDQP